MVAYKTYTVVFFLFVIKPNRMDVMNRLSTSFLFAIDTIYRVSSNMVVWRKRTFFSHNRFNCFVTTAETFSMVFHLSCLLFLNKTFEKISSNRNTQNEGMKYIRWFVYSFFPLPSLSFRYFFWWKEEKKTHDVKKTFNWCLNYIFTENRITICGENAQ